MRTESSQAKLIDRKMRSGWEKDGSKDMETRANEEAIKILETYKPLPLPTDVAKQIREIILEAEEELL
jgi:trimethylamine--corrinoid protein Co-methyltransferase